MKNRLLYLAAYDISQPKRLRAFLRLLREFSSGSQKSVFECWLSKKEKLELIKRATELMDKESDRFMLFLTHAKLPVKTLGLAQMPVDDTIFTIL